MNRYSPEWMCFFWRALEFWNQTCVTRLLSPVTDAIRSKSCPSGLLSIWKFACSTCNCSSVNVVRTRFALLLWYPSASHPSVKIVVFSENEKKFANLHFGFFLFSKFYWISKLSSTLTVTRCGSTVNCFQIMRFTQHSVVQQCKLFASGKLTTTWIACKTGQMKY